MAVVPYRVALAALALLLVLPAAGQERPAREAAAARELPGARPAAPRSALPPLAVDASVTLKRIRDSATLRIGVREASVPFSFVDAKGEPQGYSIDLCMKVADAVKAELKLPHLEVKYVPVTSANRIALVKDGKVDVECGSTTNTRDRQKEVAFAYTTFVAGIKMLAKKSSDVGGIEDLRGKTVVVTKGTTSEKMIRQLNDERLLKLTILESPDHDQSFKAVAEGKALAFPMDDVLLYGLVSKSGKPDEYAVVGKYLSVEPYALMLPKGDAPFERLVNRTLNELFISGDIRRLYAKWFATAQLTVPMNQYLKEAFQVPNTYPAWP
jgi:glutamate/aspartate transport system substrate-binding protein